MMKNNDKYRHSSTCIQHCSTYLHRYTSRYLRTHHIRTAYKDTHTRAHIHLHHLSILHIECTLFHLSIHIQICIISLYISNIHCLHIHLHHLSLYIQCTLFHLNTHTNLHHLSLYTQYTLFHLNTHTNKYTYIFIEIERKREHE